jgi:hypothetical protein
MATFRYSRPDALYGGYIDLSGRFLVRVSVGFRIFRNAGGQLSSRRRIKEEIFRKMNLSWKTCSAIAVAAVITFLGSCSSEQKQQKSGDQAKGAAVAMSTTTESAGGVEWTVPSGWVKGAERAMRAATYTIGSGDTQAECAVFFFGTGQGGDVEANIARWISQVQQPDGSDSKAKAIRGEVKSACCQIATIEVPGTYLASSGPMMQATSEKPGYVLLGGIVPAPQGNVFFKLTGPKDAVTMIKDAFMAMLESVNKRAD